MEIRVKFNQFLILVFLISLIPLLDLFHPGLFIAHDSQDHVARIANFCQSLAEGNVVPRWAAKLNWGFGHPILMFLYPLPSYAGCLFHFFGFSLVESTKIVFGLGFILSGVFMYLWVKEMWRREAGLIAGILYMFAPYRFVDLYVRGAIGENFAFIWPPLVCWFLLKLKKSNQGKYLVGGSLALAALILSHNALSLIFLPLILGYIAFLIYLSPKGKKLLFATYSSLLIILGLMVSAFFWFPAFFEGKYTLRDIVTKGNITGFERFSRLLWSPWSYGGTGSLSVQLGVLQWMGVFLAPFIIWLFRKKKDRIWIFLSFLFFCFWLAIFLILPGSRAVYFMVPLLQKFQFVWRFLSLAIFPPAIFIGALIYLLPKKFKFPTISLLLLAALLLNKDYWHAKGFLYKDESFYSGVYASTTDTGESSPRWSVRFMERFPETQIEVIEGVAKIEMESRSTTKHVYQIEAKEKTRLVENTLYFPGWTVWVDGQQTEIQFQDPAYRGLITFWLPSGERQVKIQFGETRLRLFADLVSLAGLGGLLGLGIIIKWQDER